MGELGTPPAVGGEGRAWGSGTSSGRSQRLLSRWSMLVGWFGSHSGDSGEGKGSGQRNLGGMFQESGRWCGMGTTAEGVALGVRSNPVLWGAGEGREGRPLRCTGDGQEEPTSEREDSTWLNVKGAPSCQGPESGRMWDPPLG